MKLPEMKRGEYYVHPKRGRCIYIANHPHDGAYLVMEYAGDDDERAGELFACESYELEELK